MSSKAGATHAYSPAHVKTLHQHLVAQITDRIVSNQIAPGEALPTEPELCVSFDVSRTVVREAVRVLVSKGLIEVKHGSGMLVALTDRWNLLDPQNLLGNVCQNRNAALLA